MKSKLLKFVRSAEISKSSHWTMWKNRQIFVQLSRQVTKNYSAVTCVKCPGVAAHSGDGSRYNDATGATGGEPNCLGIMNKMKGYTVSESRNRGRILSLCQHPINARQELPQEYIVNVNPGRKLYGDGLSMSPHIMPDCYCENAIAHEFGARGRSRHAWLKSMFCSSVELGSSKSFFAVNSKYKTDMILSRIRFANLGKACHVRKCCNSIVVRNFITHTQNDKDVKMKGVENDLIVKESFENEPQEEWIHPDDRTELILDKDPELKSLLRELASDFGKDKTTAGSLSESSSEDKGTDETNQVKPVECEGKETLEPISIDTDEKPEKKFVFSISDLVSVLREENARDICVISIPKEKQYVDYFVVVTGRSPRHLKALALHTNQQYKSRKTKEDPFVLVEGQDTEDWICIDFGNIVLHLMSEETREFYELEKLWTLGPEYDDQLRRLKEHEAKMKETLESLHVTRTTEEEQVDIPSILNLEDR